MEATIRRYLEKECKKLIARHESLIRQSKRDQKRFKKRTGQDAGNPKSYRPQYWEANPHFDPYYVRSRLDDIAHGLAESIRADTYQVSPAFCFSIPKPGGGLREVTIFTVPDSSLALTVLPTVRTGLHILRSNIFSRRFSGRKGCSFLSTISPGTSIRFLTTTSKIS